jgi:hypothetical protein
MTSGSGIVLGLEENLREGCARRPVAADFSASSS